MGCRFSCKAAGKPRKAERFFHFDAAFEDAGGAVAAVAQPEPARKAAALDRREKALPDAGQDVDMLMSVDEIGAAAQSIGECVDLRGYLPVDFGARKVAFAGRPQNLANVRQSPRAQSAASASKVRRASG